MSTMNIESRPQQSFVYPHFHDTQSRRTNKEMEIDKSVYHLLSLYLNADSLDKINPTSSLLSKQSLKQSSYWRTKSNRHSLPKRNWLGEEEYYRYNAQESLLERNTIKNSTTTLVHHHDESMIKTIKKRTKSVSFNETVIVISQDMKSSSQLKQAELEITTEDDDESIFVDALEFI